MAEALIETGYIQDKRRNKKWKVNMIHQLKFIKLQFGSIIL